MGSRGDARTARYRIRLSCVGDSDLGWGTSECLGVDGGVSSLGVMPAVHFHQRDLEEQAGPDAAGTQPGEELTGAKATPTPAK